MADDDDAERRWLKDWFGRAETKPGEAAQYKRIDPGGGFLYRQAILRETGLTRQEAGFPEPGPFERFFERKSAPMIWMLHKNSSVPRRIRAVAATDAQMSELDALNKLFKNSSAYAWSGYRLEDIPRARHKNVTLEEIHALAHTRRELQRPGIESRVRIEAVFTDRSNANRALERENRRRPDIPWVVITCPVGEMLF